MGPNAFADNQLFSLMVLAISKHAKFVYGVMRLKQTNKQNIRGVKKETRYVTVLWVFFLVLST